MLYIGPLGVGLILFVISMLYFLEGRHLSFFERVLKSIHGIFFLCLMYPLVLNNVTAFRDAAWYGYLYWVFLLLGLATTVYFAWMVAGTAGDHCDGRRTPATKNSAKQSRRPGRALPSSATPPPIPSWVPGLLRGNVLTPRRREEVSSSAPQRLRASRPTSWAAPDLLVSVAA